MLKGYDELTGNKFNKSQDVFSKATDFVNEMLVPSSGMSKLFGIVKEKNAFDAVRAVDPQITRAITEIAMENPDEALSQIIKNKSQGLYTVAENTGGAVKPEVVNNAIKNIMVDVQPKTVAGRKLKGKDDEITKILRRLNQFRGKSLSLEEIKDVDEVLGEFMNSPQFMDTTSGKLTDAGRKVLKIQDAFRNVIDNASPNDIIGGKEGFEALKNARKLWSQSLKARDIERIVEVSAGRTQPAQSMQTGFNTLLNNPKRIKGFSKEEINLIRKAARTNVIKDAMRLPSSRLVSMVGFGSTGNPAIGAGLEGLGMASRGMRETYQLGQASKVLEQIAKNSGIMGQKTTQAVSPLRIQGTGLAAYLTAQQQGE
jgi:hypothetical protein